LEVFYKDVGKTFGTFSAISLKRQYQKVFFVLKLILTIAKKL